MYNIVYWRHHRHQVGSCGSCPPEKCWAPRDQTDRDLPRTNGVALAYGAYATVYRSECPQGPEWPPRESGLVTGPYLCGVGLRMGSCNKPLLMCFLKRILSARFRGQNLSVFHLVGDWTTASYITELWKWPMLTCEPWNWPMITSEPWKWPMNNV